MLSEKQLEANRANAQLSTGPKSEDGKRISRMNACRHNLTGQVTSMTREDRIAHDAFSEALIKAMAPEGALELQFAQRVATDSWRLNRSSAVEDNIFALGFSAHADRNIEHPEIQAAFAAARTFTAEAKSIELLTLYEQRINRSLQRNMNLLSELQAERKARHDQAMEEAKLLAQVNPINGLAYEPERDGFVFSITEINRAIDRDNRLKAARLASVATQKPQTNHPTPIARAA